MLNPPDLDSCEGQEQTPTSRHGVSTPALLPPFIFLVAPDTPDLQPVLYGLLSWQPLEVRLCLISIFSTPRTGAA